VYQHLVGDGKCKKIMKETNMLIEEEVNQTLDMKTFAISLNAIKSFFAKHLITNNGNGSLELLKGDQL
jgi:hypothetical protein